MINKILIQQFIAHLKSKNLVSNQKEFAFKIGYGSESSLSQAIRKVPLPVELINKIKKVYPEFEKWHEEISRKHKEVPENLIEKVPNKRKTFDPIYEIQTVPVYDSTASLGLVEIFKGSENGNVLSYISIPNLPKSDGAIFMTGDSMYPLLKSGDIVALKIINKLDIIYGEMYYVEYYGEDGEMEFKAVKYVKKSDLGNEYVQLVSYNQHHEPKDIFIDRIKTIAIVNASIRYNRL